MARAEEARRAYEEAQAAAEAAAAASRQAGDRDAAYQEQLAKVTATARARFDALGQRECATAHDWLKLAADLFEARRAFLGALEDTGQNEREKGLATSHFNTVWLGHPVTRLFQWLVPLMGEQR